MSNSFVSHIFNETQNIEKNRKLQALIESTKQEIIHQAQLTKETLTTAAELAKETLTTADLLAQQTIIDATILAKEKLNIAVLLAQQTIADATPYAQQTLDTAVIIAQQTITDATPLAKQTLNDASTLAKQTITDATPLAQQTLNDASLLAKQTIIDATPLAKQTLNDASTLAKQTITDAKLLRQSTIGNIEFLLDPKHRRKALHPIIHEDIWSFYKNMRAAFWTPEEIDLSSDLNDWYALTNDERHFLKYVLAFFAGSDFIVEESQEIDEEEITLLEYKFCNHIKFAMEDIHIITYANLIDTYITSEVERIELFNSIQHIPVIGKKAEWVRQYYIRGNIVDRIIATAILEGIFFSGSFCAIFWMKKRGKMVGLTIANEFISRDEGMHRDLACLLYRKYVNTRIPVEELKDRIRKAVAIEKEFCCEALPSKLIGINSDSMSQYIEYVADHLCLHLTGIDGIDGKVTGGERVFNSENPFDWMVLQSVETKTDLFSSRSSSYSMASINATKESNQIVFTEDF